MIAVPGIKIARPLNSPRSVRKTSRIKGKLPSSRSEFEDQETLAKQKNDIILEILALRQECDSLQAQVYDKENDFDEQQALEIQYLSSVDDKSGSEYKRRVLVYTKQVAQLESEMNDLSDKYTFLSTYFSEDSIFRLKNEIVYEKNSIGHQRDDLRAVIDVRNKAEEELNSNDLAKGVNMCRNQKSHLVKLKKELKESQEKEIELNNEYESTLELPKKIEEQQKEIEELQKRLDNCQHAKFSKQRDINKKKEEVEQERSVMNNVAQNTNVQKNRKKERENFTSTMTGTRSSRIFGRNGRIIDVPAFRKSQKAQKESDDESEKSDSQSDSDNLNETGKSNTSARSEKSKSSEKSGDSGDEKKSDDEGSEKKSDDEDNEKKSDDDDSDKKSDDDDDSDKKSDDDDDSDKKSDDDDDSDKKSDDDDDSDKKSDDDDDEKKSDDDDDDEKKSDDDDDTDKNSDTDEME